MVQWRKVGNCIALLRFLLHIFNSSCNQTCPSNGKCFKPFKISSNYKNYHDVKLDGIAKDYFKYLKLSNGEKTVIPPQNQTYN